MQLHVTTLSQVTISTNTQVTIRMFPVHMYPLPPFLYSPSTACTSTRYIWPHTSQVYSCSPLTKRDPFTVALSTAPLKFGSWMSLSKASVTASSLYPGQIVLPYEALAKEPSKSRLGHCDLDSPQPINCQCEMPHHNYLFMIIFLSPVLLFWKVACKTRVHDVHKLNRPIR